MSILCTIMIYFIAVDDLHGEAREIQGEILDYNMKLEVYKVDLKTGFIKENVDRVKNIDVQYISKSNCRFEGAKQW